MKIIVTEIQKFESGAMSTPSYAFDSQQAAEAKYHSILASAANSALPVHACIMFSEEGFPLRHECYKHEAETETVE
ncbi:MAG: hypothetical protein II433_10010 [Acidaminococcaceae bacterium]|nr:hypothetical protein [Acidaminococcaceae bacterium]